MLKQVHPIRDALNGACYSFADLAHFFLFLLSELLQGTFGPWRRLVTPVTGQGRDLRRPENYEDNKAKDSRADSQAIFPLPRLLRAGVIMPAKSMRDWNTVASKSATRRNSSGSCLYDAHFPYTSARSKGMLPSVSKTFERVSMCRFHACEYFSQHQVTSGSTQHPDDSARLSRQPT